MGTVEVQIPDSYAVTHLIVSSSSSITSPTEYTLTDNGDGTLSTTVDFSDGEFFTFGIGVSPGDVSGDLALWLKADAGVTESSGDVSAWADQSGSGYNFSDSGTSPYTYDDDGLNYNPEIENTDGSNRRLVNTTSIALQTVVIVTHPDNPGNCDNPFSEYNVDDEGIRACASSGAAWNLPGNANGFATASGQAWYNGASASNPTHNNLPSIIVAEAPAPTTISNGIELGDSRESRYWHGSIAEVIGYGDALSTSEREQIQTYLAIKYGISLTTDYVASDASSLWDATTNASYSNDIAGIGRDDASALDQRQSSSQSGAIVEIGLGALAADNASNGNAFSADASFLIWGHDNASSSVATDFSGTLVTSRMARIWTAEETGTVGTVEVQLPDSYGANYLIVSSSSSLTSPAEYLLTDNGDGTWSTTVDFSDGEFFTFGSGAAPGGVASNLALWLKADADVSLSGGNVSTWNDQSGNGNHATTGGGAVTQNTAALNYNPSLDWDNTSDYLSGTSDLGLDNDNTLSMFFVLIDNGSNDYSEVFALSTYDDEHRFEDSATFGSWAFYDDSFTSNLYVYASSPPSDRTSWAIVSGIYTGTQYSAYLNGTLGISRSFTQGIDTDAGSTYSIGFAHNGSIHGSAIFELTELVVYSSDVSSTQSQIESYLALKYGIHLSGNYVASDATTLWDATTNSPTTTMSPASAATMPRASIRSNRIRTSFPLHLVPSLLTMRPTATLSVLISLSSSWATTTGPSQSLRQR